jgi:hypothetical protein
MEKTDRPRASSKIIINSPSDAVWQTISDFGAVCKYSVMVTNCTVEGAGVGALRTLTNADGSTIVERLEGLDHIAHRLSYALLSDTPFSNCLTTMELHDLGKGRCEVAWSATFDADGLPESEAMEMLEGMFELNSRALERFLTQWYLDPPHSL